METAISSRLERNTEYLYQALRLDKNFDILSKELSIAGHPACFYMIDGLNKDEILEKIIESLNKTEEKDMPQNVKEMMQNLIPYGEVELESNMEHLIIQILSGVPMLLIDGFTQAIAIDFRTYPARSVEEPEKDKVLRGSRDGFVETIVFNTALIRRRIRNPHLIMEITQVGKSSHTDIVLCYMDDRIDSDFLKSIRSRIQSLSVDSLTMSNESLAEALYKRKWFNPFPKFKYTERPDTAAAAVLEGSLIILVDNSPSAIILPTTLFEITEEADDYYFPPVTGTYLRLSRMLINLVALFFTPVWLLLMNHPQWLPPSLEFLLIDDPIHVPLIWQLLILEFAIDGLKLAAMNTPSMLSTPLSVIAGIVLGDYTVDSGWFNSETMLYMAFVAIANYSQASIELGYALKFLRIIMLILTGIFNLPGFLAGVAITILCIAFNKTVSGNSYLYPLIPFNGKELLRRCFRLPQPAVQKPKK
ncbi:MAG: spore germination protein [Blautia sp.]